MQRVQKLLSNYGYCSRRKAEELIEQGRVDVNGKTISIGDKASEYDKITVDGRQVSKERKVYLMFNKPFGCVCALKDSRYKTIMEYINVKERVFPVGRLDYNTEGLLLLTNDGDFANNIMHPRYEIKKTYLVGLDQPLQKDHTKMIESGVELEDGRTSRSTIKKRKPDLVEITIHEGKNRIVRRIFKKLGYKVLNLRRIMIGRLELGELKSGKYKTLSEKQIKRIFS